MGSRTCHCKDGCGGNQCCVDGTDRGLDLIGVCRIALVGFIIVMMYEADHSSWTGAIYRVISVVGGCMLGLLINYTFRRLTSPMFQKFAATGAAENEGAE